MSRENIEVIERWIAGFTDAAPSGAVKALVTELWDRNSDYYPVQKFPDAQPRHGAEEIAAFMEAWRDAWETYELTATEIVPIDDARLFVRISVQAHGHATQVSVDGDLYFSMWMRDGRILRSEDHLTEAGACRGLGLDADALAAARLRA